jgi:hypothetical protein
LSIHHRSGVYDSELLEASSAELYSALGANDTPKLFERPFEVDAAYDVPTGAGNSIDRKTVYVDRDLYAEVMDGEFKASGLSPGQIIDRWLDHEHTELVIVDGDNPVTTYLPAHQRALRREHEGVLAILGRDNAEQKIEAYENAIWPGLLRAYHKAVKKPPPDLWCGPIVDDPEPRDLEIARSLKSLGVADAGKKGKFEVRYGTGANHCRTCGSFRPDKLSEERGALALCEGVSGLVRDELQCDLWHKAKVARTPQDRIANAAQASGVTLTPVQGDPFAK